VRRGVEMCSDGLDTNKRIEQATAVLLGKTMWRCIRAGDLAMFAFGRRRNVKDFYSRDSQVGEHALHIQCAWHIAKGERIIVGRRDMYYPPDLSVEVVPPDFDWDKGPTRRDVLLKSLFDDGSREFRVEMINVTSGGGLHITMEDNLTLNILPDDSLSHEHWRLFTPDSQDAHFIFTGQGIRLE
jgi:hypothetical protein